MRKLTALLLALLTFVSVGICFAEENGTSPKISDVRMIIGDNCVAYPQLEGMADSEIQRRINDDIVASANITGHIATLSAGGIGNVNVDYKAFIGGDVFSAVISAKGKQPKGRNGHEYSALCYDLRTGERLKASDLFKDADEAAAIMEEMLDASLSEELNSYFDNCELYPLPIESFAVDSDGITFLYPSKQLTYLSGYAGACQFNYCEIADLLIDDENGIPSRLKAFADDRDTASARLEIETYIKEGKLPHVPAAIGESLTEIIGDFGLMRTPDDFPGGRYYRLEDAKFRDAYIISDNIRGSGEWEHSVVEGIRIERGELCGLIIGKANRADWLDILGKPNETIEFSENMAYDYALPVGKSDVYAIGGKMLSLHADEDGVLRCVRLQKQ